MGKKKHTRLSNAAITVLEAQVTMEEMKAALRKEKNEKHQGMTEYVTNFIQYTGT
jgi:hypothetical protein